MEKIFSFPLLRLRFLLQKSSFIRDEEETKIEKKRSRKMTRYCWKLLLFWCQRRIRLLLRYQTKATSPAHITLHKKAQTNILLILAHPVYPISTLNINIFPLSWYHHPSFSPRQKTIPSSSSHASPSLFPQQRKRSLASSSEMRISAFDVPISPFPLPLLSRFLISPIQFRKSTHAPPPPPLPPPPPHSLAFIDPRKGEKIFFPPPFLQDWCQEKMTSKTTEGYVL